MSFDFEAYQAEQIRKDREEAAELLAVAIEIAAELGDWCALAQPENSNCVILTGPNHEEIGLRRGWKASEKGRVFIAGRFSPQMEKAAYKLDHASISCAISRGGRALAKEIQKRVLPTYLAEFERATTAVHEDLAKKSRRASVLAMLKGILPTRDRHVSEEDGRIWHYRPGTKKTDVKVNYGGTSVELELEVSPELAAEILALVLKESD